MLQICPACQEVPQYTAMQEATPPHFHKHTVICGCPRTLMIRLPPGYLTEQYYRAVQEAWDSLCHSLPRKPTLSEATLSSTPPNIEHRYPGTQPAPVDPIKIDPENN